MLSEKFFDTGDVVLEYGEGPDSGPPLVFLVGAPNRFQSYCLDIIDKLSQRWHVYAVNHRGTGKSGKVQGKYRLIDFINDTAKFVDALPEPPVLVGHSFGGMISIGVSARLGTGIRGMILGDPPLSNQALIDWINAPHGFKDFLGLLVKFKEDNASSGEIAVSMGEGVVTPWSLEKSKTFGYHDKSLIESLRDPENLVEGIDLSGDLAKIECPTLLIQADKVGMGQAITDVDVEYAKKVMPSVVHVFAEGLSHELGIDIAYTSPAIMMPIMQFLEYLRP
jgi:pimeloyl-ACP methyl ester carboxylesterase